MKHLKFYLKYYKYYYDLEIEYTPDYVFEEKRQQRLKFNYDSSEVFRNDKDKEFSHVFIRGRDGKRYYKKRSMMSIKEKRQFVADYLSRE